MEHDLVLEGRVVTPSGIQDIEVGVSDGIIERLGHGLKGSRRVRTERSLVFPGFIDIHVHLREPGWERKEDFRTGTLAASHGGVTTVVDMPNNPTPANTAAVLERKAALARAKARVGVMFHAGVPEDDFGGLRGMADRAAGFKLYMSETTGMKAFPDAKLAEAFAAVASTGKPLSIHCEDQGVIDRKRAELGSDPQRLSYSDLRPPEAEATAVARALDVMKRTPNLNANICHASTRDTLRLVRGSKKSNVNARCEATLHHLFFNRKDLESDPMLRTNPPLREEEDRRAMLDGLRDGTVSFLVTDHAPHTREEKMELGLAGVPGLDDYSHIVSWLVRAQEFDPAHIAKVASSNPAKHLRLQDRGEIAVGKRADFSVVDLHSPEKSTGEKVMSKCGWTAFEGEEFPGRARWTIVGGEVVLDDYEVLT